MRHDFDRQTAFKEFLFVEIVNGRGFGGDDRVVKPVVLLLSSDSSDSRPSVVDAAGRDPGSGSRFEPSESDLIRGSRRSSPSRRAKHLLHVDRLGENDRADCVVEIKVIAADDAGDVCGQAL